MDHVITTAGLRKSFPANRRRVEAVRGVSIDVGHGEIFGFLGPNGAGKTTTVRMLTTLLPIDAGTATVAGLDVARRPGQVRSRIGYVSQLGGADEQATGWENLVLQGRLYGSLLPEARRRAGELAALLELSEFAGRRVRTYSGGQRRRLDIALGIVHDPEVLFLDEPSTGLDPQNRASLWGHIRSLREQGTTVFLTTHYLEEADALCDRLVIIDHGRVVAEGRPRDLKKQVAGDAVMLVLRDGCQAAVRGAELLRRQSYVRELTTAGDRISLYVHDGGAALPHLLRVLDGARVAISSVQLSEPTLDDVFLRKTGRRLRDTGEAPEGRAAA